MEFRHSGNSGARRRRILFDDANHSANSTEKKRVTAEATPRRAANYANAAQADCETRVADLIPTRVWTLCVLFLLGLVVIAALINAHQRHDAWAKYLTPGCLEILDLSKPANLAAWFSSAGLALGALTAIFIYRMRRHRVDDYRARYRVWLWASLGLLAASVHAICGLHEFVQGVTVHFSGTNLWGDGYIWWTIIATAFTTPLTVVLLIDMRRSRFSNFMLLGALGCYGLAATLKLEFIMKEDFPLYFEACSGATLLGNLLVIMSLCLFSRHILLAVQKKFPPVKSSIERRKNTKKTPQKSANNSTKTHNQTDQQTKKIAPAPRSRRNDLDPSATDDSDQVTNTDSDINSRQKLSKAERRRLRKELRRQNKAA